LLFRDAMQNASRVVDGSFAPRLRLARTPPRVLARTPHLVVRTPSHVARAARRTRKGLINPTDRTWVILALALLVGFALIGLHFGIG
jgi:hypothetical protein